MKLVDGIKVCGHCERDMEYMGLGEWNCECGKNWYAEWLDGPGLVEWLQEQTDLPRARTARPSLDRRAREWENGGLANFYTADRWLVRLSLLTCELPDHLWREAPTRGRAAKAVSDEDKRAALRRVESGESMAWVAFTLGVTPRAVAYWRDKLVAA